MLCAIPVRDLAGGLPASGTDAYGSVASASRPALLARRPVTPLAPLVLPSWIGKRSFNSDPGEPCMVASALGPRSRHGCYRLLAEAWPSGRRRTTANCVRAQSLFAGPNPAASARKGTGPELRTQAPTSFQLFAEPPASDTTATRWAQSLGPVYIDVGKLSRRLNVQQVADARRGPMMRLLRLAHPAGGLPRFSADEKLSRESQLHVKHKAWRLGLRAPHP